MPTETIVGVAIVIAVGLILAFVVKLILKREPRDKYFKCSRCGTTTRHTERTIEAWRNNKTKFFCQSCHAKWLDSQPLRVREQLSSRAAASGSGCMVMVAMFALVPLGCLLMWVW